MANNWYLVSDLIGGADGALDAIDGAELNDGDRAIGVMDGQVVFYILDATSGVAESSPEIIAPDSNAITKRWIQIESDSATSPIEFSDYDATNYPITALEEASLSSYDAFARGRTHTITENPSYPGTSSGCAILAGENNEITNMQEGWNVIAGGYQNQMDGAEYSAILCGSFNIITSDITAPPYGLLICGGEGNAINVTAGPYEYNTIVGGEYNLIGNYVADSFIGGGGSNGIEGSVGTPIYNAFIGGGGTNLVYASKATICGGTDNEIESTGTSSFIGGGYNNTASGTMAVVSGGEINNASGNYSTITGGTNANAYLFGQQSYSSGIKSAGRAQISEIIAGKITTDATETELFLDGSSEQAVLPASRTWKFTIDLCARQTAGTSGTVGDSAFWTIVGSIKRDASNNTALVGTPQGSGTPASTDRDADAATWSVAVTADDTNESLKITGTGEANKTICWVAKVSLVEVG